MTLHPDGPALASERPLDRAAAPPAAPGASDLLRRALRAGLVTGIVDGLWACVLVTVFYHSTITRLWQGVAATLLGPSALQGGTATAAIGVAMHFGVALGWSAVFLALAERSRRVRRLLASRLGPLKAAAVFGPFVWMVMSLLVIPILTHRPPRITIRWWIQLLGHIPFVGLPIAWMVGQAYRDGEPGRS
ncbi:MAG TPA: hypothetical protein VF771_01020 [Longimicrobiaceae bacterium]